MSGLPTPAQVNLITSKVNLSGGKRQVTAQTTVMRLGSLTTSHPSRQETYWAQSGLHTTSPAPSEGDPALERNDPAGPDRVAHYFVDGRIGAGEGGFIAQMQSGLEADPPRPGWSSVP